MTLSVIMSYGMSLRNLKYLQRQNPIAILVGVDTPPYTETFLVANVAGTTPADDIFWDVHCQVIPSSTLFIIVQMGNVFDFFRPIGDASYCDMLQAHTKHEWSSDGVTWITPDFDSDSDSDPNGGSERNWPDEVRDGDARSYLSFWGTDYKSLTGGCCSTSTAVYETYPALPENGESKSWGQQCT